MPERVEILDIRGINLQRTEGFLKRNMYGYEPIHTLRHVAPIRSSWSQLKPQDK